jgi:ribosomal protein L11 methylase PrmA
VIELVLDVPAARGDAAILAISATGVMGMQIEDADTGAPPGRVVVHAWYPPGRDTEALARRLAEELGGTSTLRAINADWAAPEGHPLGGRFSVNGDLPRRKRIDIDTTLAFGDGLHPTTQMCVRVLEGLKPKVVLDVGTGTGVLAVVAAKLGATRVVATEIDPLARYAAARTFERNGVTAEVLDTLPTERFEVVVANLYLAPLLDLLPVLSGLSDTLVVSGFLGSAVEQVCARVPWARAVRTQGEWACVVLRKR